MIDDADDVTGELIDHLGLILKRRDTPELSRMTDSDPWRVRHGLCAANTTCLLQRCDRVGAAAAGWDRLGSSVHRYVGAWEAPETMSVGT